MLDEQANATGSQDAGYLAWYETTDEKVEPGPDFQRLVAEPTEWSKRMRTLYGEQRERMSFRLMRDVAKNKWGQGHITQQTGNVALTPFICPWLYIVHTDIPDDIVDEYNDWYDKEHLPRLVTVPGVIRARRYTAVAGSPRYLTAYELTDRDAFASPERLKARKTPWTAKMRSLFQNTRRRMCRLITPTLTHEQTHA